MPFVNNNGVRIHYEVEGDGLPLVLQHGFAGSIQTWYERGYVGGLKQHFRLILLDARGHGQSDKPHDAESYSAALFVSDIVAVLDGLNVRKTHYHGYSMGGRLGYAIAEHAPQRFHSLALGGFSPNQNDAEQAAIAEIRQRFQMEPQELVATLEAAGTTLSPERKAHLLSNDHAALRLVLDTLDGMHFAAAPPTVALPTLLFAGADDPRHEGMKRSAALMPNAAFVTLPGLNHGQASQRSDLVLPHITAFLNSINTPTAERYR